MVVDIRENLRRRVPHSRREHRTVLPSLILREKRGQTGTRPQIELLEISFWHRHEHPHMFAAGERVLNHVQQMQRRPVRIGKLTARRPVPVRMRD